MGIYVFLDLFLDPMRRSFNVCQGLSGVHFTNGSRERQSEPVLVWCCDASGFSHRLHHFLPASQRLRSLPVILSMRLVLMT